MIYLRLEDLFEDIRINSPLIQEPVKDMQLLAKQTLGMFNVEYSIPEGLVRKKHRVFIVPETHLKDTNIKTRKNYVAEMKDVHMAVRSVVNELKPDFTIYMGEIFNGSFTYAKDILFWMSEFLEMNTVTKVITLKGNHEESYYKNNPFWYMAKGAGINGLGIFKLPPNLVLDDVVLTFHHFGVEPKYIRGKKNIGLMHTDVMNPTLRKYLEVEDTYIHDMQTPAQHLFPEYDMVFNGHMHKLCRQLKINRPAKPLYLFYTASLGRTNITEVDNDFRTRYIYVLDIEGDNVDINLIPIVLPKYEDVVDEETRRREVIAYTNQKERKQLKKLTDMASLDVKDLFNGNYLLEKIYYKCDTVHPNVLVDSLHSLYRRSLDEC